MPRRVHLEQRFPSASSLSHLDLPSRHPLHVAFMLRGWSGLVVEKAAAGGLESAMCVTFKYGRSCRHEDPVLLIYGRPLRRECHSSCDTERGSW